MKIDFGGNVRFKALMAMFIVVLVAFGIVFYLNQPYSEAARGGIKGKPKRTSTPTPTQTLAATLSPWTTPTSPAVIPAPIYGVTVDDIRNNSATVTALTKLPKKMTVRIVFDPGMNPSDYQDAVNQIHSVAYVMGQPVDSSSMKRYSVDQYRSRFQEYLNAFGNTIELWEVGNEVNGEWLGSASDVSAKIAAAYDVVKAAGKTSVLTLHFNEGPDCPTYPINEMYSWVQTFVPDRMKQGVNYVLFSYFPENCPEIKPDWNAEFTHTGNVFPNSKLGFGELGYEVGTQAQKESLIREFYPKQISHPRYVKGIFWWYFKEEMVPYTNYLWGVLNQAISS